MSTTAAVPNHQDLSSTTNATKIPPSTKKRKDRLVLGKNISIAERIRWIQLPNLANVKIKHWPGIIYKSYTELYKDFKSNNRLSSEIKAKILLQDHRKLLQQKMSGKKADNTSNDFIIAIVCLGNSYGFHRFVDPTLVSKIKRQIEPNEDDDEDDDDDDCGNDEDQRILPFYPYFEKFENQGTHQMGPDFCFQYALEQVQEFLEEEVKHLGGIDFIGNDPYHNEEIADDNFHSCSSQRDMNKVISPEGCNESEESKSQVKEGKDIMKLANSSKNGGANNVIARSIDVEFQGENVNKGKMNALTKKETPKVKQSKQGAMGKNEKVQCNSPDVRDEQILIEAAAESDGRFVDKSEDSTSVEEDANTTDSQFGDEGDISREDEEELVLDDGLKVEPRKASKANSNKYMDAKRKRNINKSGNKTKKPDEKKYKRQRLWGRVNQTSLGKKNRTPVTKLTFTQVWTTLRSKGWKAIKARNKLHYWYYLKPHVDYDRKLIHGEPGVDYFLSEDDLLEYLESNREILSPDSSTASPVSNQSSTDESQTISAEHSDTHASSDDEESVSDGNVTPQKETVEYNFSYVWQYLKKKGWKAIKARNKLHDWYYLKPNVEHSKSGVDGKAGLDYFLSESDLLEYLKENDHLLSPNSEISDEDNSSDHQDNDAYQSPVLATKNDISVSERLNYSSDRSLESSSSSLGNEVWWKSFPIPDFKADVWPILKNIVRYKSGKYCVKAFEKEFKFEKVEEAQKFLAIHGLELGPNQEDHLDEGKLELLSRWISLAHLPTRVDDEFLRSHNSLDILSTIPAVDSDQAWKILCDEFGFAFTSNGRLFAPNVGSTWDLVTCEDIKTQYFDSIEQVQKFIRSHGMISGLKETRDLATIMLWASGADVDPFICNQEGSADTHNNANIEDESSNNYNLNQESNSMIQDINHGANDDEMEVDQGTITGASNCFNLNQNDHIYDPKDDDIVVDKIIESDTNCAENNDDVAESEAAICNNDDAENVQKDTVMKGDQIIHNADASIYLNNKVTEECVETKSTSSQSTSSQSRSPRYVDSKSVLEGCTAESMENTSVLNNSCVKNVVSESKSEEVYEDCMDYEDDVIDEYSHNRSCLVGPQINGDNFLTQENPTSEDYYELRNILSD